MESEVDHLGTADPGDATLQSQGANKTAASHVSNTNTTSAEIPGLKRKNLTSDAFTRRKRATTACQFCRLRKTKCDNARPICGFCQYHKAKCVYGEFDPLEGPESRSVDRPDAVQREQREIIDRLDEIRDLLLQGNRQEEPENSTSGDSASKQWPTTATAAADAVVTPITPLTAPSNSDLHSTTSSGTSRDLGFTRCEKLLRWPIFNNVIGEEDRKIESFALEAESGPTKGASQQSHHQPKVIVEDAFVPLCQKFLDNVHTRNPILDGDDLLVYAKHVTENGLAWDTPSCLVLIACAAASLTQPWQYSPPASLDNLEGSHAQSGTAIDEEGFAAAESYFFAAKKRIGILGSSILDMQCFFFASVYEKCCLRPLQAWFYVQEVCTRLEAYLLRRGRASHLRGPRSGPETRLFWSCIRLEGEIASSLGLRHSGLDDFIYPDMFPKPPANLSGSENLGSTQDRELTNEERSWYFYMAGISVWRLFSTSIWLLYRKGEEYWLRDIDDVLRHYEDSQGQIVSWYTHLPESLKFETAQRPHHELAVYFQVRYHSWRELILRPILYYVLHRPREQCLEAPVLTLAQECVDLCSTIIVINLDHHRHGGTWFVLRAMFTAAMLILAVVCKSRDGGELCPPNQWQRLTKAAIATMERWERHSPAVGRMRITLERVFGDVWRRTGLAVADLVDADASLSPEGHYAAPPLSFLEA